jgi:NADH-ubiquinone oxidoreductase chain 2
MHNSLYYTFNITPIGALTIKNLLILISVISLIIGAIGGLYQLNIKRLITFGYLSSFSFSSKVLINSSTSLRLAHRADNHQSLISTLVPGQIGSFDLNFITQLTGLFTNNPILTMSFAISLFSMAGIPPMIGFFAKQQVLLSSLSIGFIFVAIIAITSSVVSAYYYLKLIQVSTFSNNNLLSRL